MPPGRNARLVVGASIDGRERTLFDEGWPDVNRTGRRIALQKLLLVVGLGAFEVQENGRRLFQSKETLLPRDAIYLYLQLASHSNYPAREVFFDDIRVTAAGHGNR